MFGGKNNIILIF